MRFRHYDNQDGNICRWVEIPLSQNLGIVAMALNDSSGQLVSDLVCIVFLR